MFLTITRTFKEAIKNFIRNGWLSIATVSILIMLLYILSVFFIITSIVNDVLKETQDKVDISISFQSDISEQSILEVKNELEKFSEIKSVTYVSKEQALENFKKSSTLRPIILQTLDVLGSNPLLNALVIKANDVNQYQLISEYIKKAPFNNKVSRTNYDEHKDAINKLNYIIAVIKKIGTALGLFFTIISLLITFNAIRITIYTHKQEVEIMRLVGASNSFIRMPFIFEGVIYGVVSSIFSMLILFISIKFITPYVSSVVPTSNLVGFYLSNFWSLLGGQILFGSLLGVIGSIIAMQKYLKV